MEKDSLKLSQTLRKASDFASLLSSEILSLLLTQNLVFLTWKHKTTRIKYWFLFHQPMASQYFWSYRPVFIQPFSLYTPKTLLATDEEWYSSETAALVKKPIVRILLWVKTQGKTCKRCLQLLTKARDFTTKESLRSTHILNLRRLLNTRIFLPITLTGSENVS